MSETKALQFGSRFSFPPNSLGYCGKNTAAFRFKDCILNGNCKGVEKEFKEFIVLYPYLKTLSKLTKKPLFSHDVFESYWLGNNHLKKVKLEDYMLLLKNFEDQAVPDFFIQELKNKEPKVFIPTHLFQVLHIGVGRASMSVPFNLKSINNCMIRWGVVEKISKNKAIIGLNSLERNGKEKFKLIRKQNTIPFDQSLISGLKTGDMVAVHWNMVIKKLNLKEVENLKHWTNEVLSQLRIN